LLRRAPIVHLASTAEDGSPVLRALDAAVLDDAVAFHGSMASVVPSRTVRSAPGLRP